MALSNILQELEGTGPAKENRVTVLLRMLEGTEDHDVLLNALHGNMRHATVTLAIRREYGFDSVRDTSVREWRLKNGNREVNGL